MRGRGGLRLSTCRLAGYHIMPNQALVHPPLLPLATQQATVGNGGLQRTITGHGWWGIVGRSGLQEATMSHAAGFIGPQRTAVGHLKPNSEWQWVTAGCRGLPRATQHAKAGRGELR
jgi:hypothetical protein